MGEKERKVFKGNGKWCVATQKNLKLVKELGPCWKETFVDGHLEKKVETWL
jgi:hypothetical protein